MALTSDIKLISITFGDRVNQSSLIIHATSLSKQEERDIDKNLNVQVIGWPNDHWRLIDSITEAISKFPKLIYISKFEAVLLHLHSNLL